MNEPLSALSATRLSDLLASGDVRPDDLLEACLRQINRMQPRLNAFSHVAVEPARRAAAAARERQRLGQRLSRVDGIPLSVKDNLYVAGLPATWGSRLFENHVAARDDIAIERVRAAGAVIIGKTNTPEFALAGRTENLLVGLTRNPWNPALNPGGSSGGAVAGIASGCAPLALATDAGGSGRLPASFTGVCGMRPSNGQIPRRYGFAPLAPDFQVIAPIARVVADLQLLFNVLKGPDPRDPLSFRTGTPIPIRRADEIQIRVATAVEISNGSRRERLPVDGVVLRQVEAAGELLRGLGYRVSSGPVPYDLDEVRAVWRTLAAVGVARVLSDREDWQTQVSSPIAVMAGIGAAITGVEYALTLDRLAAIRGKVSDAWTDYDVLLTPTSAAPAFAIELPHPAEIDGQPADALSMSIFTTWVNACGLPALSIPTLPHDDGRPIGMQLVGRFGADELLLNVAQSFESAQPWASRWPAASLG